MSIAVPTSWPQSFVFSFCQAFDFNLVGILCRFFFFFFTLVMDGSSFASWIRLSFSGSFSGHIISLLIQFGFVAFALDTLISVLVIILTFLSVFVD